jgi:DNA repair exonuclease SbcCD nuclease subunit
MIVEEKIWNKQEDFEWASSFIRRNKFDLIVSGDNHQFFTANFDNRYLFNCGSLMRSTTAQLEHKPKVVLFDTDSRRARIIEVPIEPAEKVFRLDEVLKEKERDEKLDAFISGLTQHKEMSLSFEENLNAYAKENKINPKIMNIIKECMV